MAKQTASDLINEAVQLLKSDNTNIFSSKDTVNQLAWLLFLKCLDISGIHRQLLEHLTLERANGVWQYSWASLVKELLQSGDTRKAESLRFLHEQFLPKLGELFGPKSEHFQVNSNFITFQRLLQLVDGIQPARPRKKDPFHSAFSLWGEPELEELESATSEAKDFASQAYNALFVLLTEENKKTGIFATPQAITQFMVQILSPGLQDIIYDPACGTGNFLLEAWQQNSAIKSTQLYGRDSAEQVIQLARMHLLLYGIDPEQLQQQEVGHVPDSGKPSLSDTSLPEASVILTHPPLGDYPAGTRTTAQGAETFDCYEAWFLQHIWEKLQKNTPEARCGMVLSGSFLSSKDEQKVHMRKQLLRKWNVLMIVWLPKIAFSPKSQEKTYLLFFNSQPPTKKILYYNLASRLGHHTYTYKNPLKDTDFAEVLIAWEHWMDHLEHPKQVPEPVQTEHQWVMKCDPDEPPALYSLLPDPPPVEETDKPTCEELLATIKLLHLQQQEHIQALEKRLSEQ